MRRMPQQLPGEGCNNQVTAMPTHASTSLRSSGQPLGAIMLAYVFWHAVPDNFATADYEKNLLHFGDALANAKIPGLLGNASYAIGQTPWLGEPGYEDWTWLEGSW